MLTNHLLYLSNERRNHWHDSSCNGRLRQLRLVRFSILPKHVVLGKWTQGLSFSSHSISTPYSLSDDSSKQTGKFGWRMKLSPGITDISRIRRFLSTDTTKALVHAFVTSRVGYCNSLFYGLRGSPLNKAQRVLNAATRQVCRASRYCRITPLLYGLHWLPVRQRISFKILLFVFKAIHGFAPTYLRELVSIKRSGNYNLRSSSDGLLLATPTYRSRVTLGDRSFQVAAPALWNVLPREIRSITDLGIFKRHLKTHLFREAFY